MRLSVVRPIETRKFIAVSRQYLKTEVRVLPTLMTRQNAWHRHPSGAACTDGVTTLSKLCHYRGALTFHMLPAQPSYCTPSLLPSQLWNPLEAMHVGHVGC